MHKYMIIISSKTDYSQLMKNGIMYCFHQSLHNAAKRMIERIYTSSIRNSYTKDLLNGLELTCIAVAGLSGTSILTDLSVRPSKTVALYRQCRRGSGYHGVYSGDTRHAWKPVGQLIYFCSVSPPSMVSVWCVPIL